MGVKAQERPVFGRGRVLAAVAPPAEPELRKEVMAELNPLDAEIFERTLAILKGLPELGVLLREEKELPALVQQVYRGVGEGLFADEELENWEDALSNLYSTLEKFAQKASTDYQGRLYAQDAKQVLDLLWLCRTKFDVVVMNPPFGASAKDTKDKLTEDYPRSKNDLLAIFVERGLELLRAGGRLGAITSRTCFFLSSFKNWREQVVLGLSKPEVMADLGYGVMDDAMVEAAAYVLEKQP
jgi:hypothetical protein